jgi:RHS repeat-associated protein
MSDATALRRYTETYEYDAVGNITRLLHEWGAPASSWSRSYEYASTSNRLLSTSLPGDVSAPFSAAYTYDAAGNMTSMPHLASMTWDPNEHLRAVDLGGGGTAYYTYDAGGQRVRKVIVNGSSRTERLYLDGAELYREYASGALDKRRETLRVMDGEHAVAEIDTLTVESGSAVPSVMNVFRYQLENHLRSSAFELSETAAIIAYEEFYPYGSTSFEVSDSEVPARRYRYTGMERDEETGLQRHGVRYYAPWLGRWISADPTGGLNVYEYCSSRPMTLVDITGESGEPTLLESHYHVSDSSLHSNYSLPPPTADEIATVAGHSPNLPANLRYFSAATRTTPNLPAASYAPDPYRLLVTPSTTISASRPDDRVTRATTPQELAERTNSDLSLLRTSPGASFALLTNPFGTDGDRRSTALQLGPVLDLGAFGYFGARAAAPASMPRGIAPFVGSQSPLDEVRTETPNVWGTRSTPLRVYRVQGGDRPNASRRELGAIPPSYVRIYGRRMLYLNFGQPARAREFAALRGPSAYVISFEVTGEFIERVRSLSFQPGRAEYDANRPQLTDVTRAPDQYGVPASWSADLLGNIIPGSVRRTPAPEFCPEIPYWDMTRPRPMRR